MRKVTEAAAIPQVNQSTLVGFSEADQNAWASLVKLSTAVALAVDQPRAATPVELHAAAEFKRIKAELRTNFE
jgi:hypothetical protein